MTILCVEDEKLLLEDTVSMCRELLTETDTVLGFSRSGDALEQGKYERHCIGRWTGHTALSHDKSGIQAAFTHLR